jgi:transposase
VAGRTWLKTQPLALDETLAIQRYLADLDCRVTDLSVLDRALAQRALQDKRVERLMTISGIHVTVALGLLAAIGDVSRFASSEKLVSYLGLNPSVRQSGDGRAHHGRITKHGRAHARAMLVEAAWAAARAPGPLRAFFMRIQSRRGKQVAAVATARKIAVLAWHLLTKDENYAWHGRHCWPASFASWSCSQANLPPRGADRAPHMPITIAQSANGSELGLNKPREPTRASSQTGGPTPVGARAPQTGSVRHRRAAGSHSYTRSSPRGHPCPITIAPNGKMAHVFAELGPDGSRVGVMAVGGDPIRRDTRDRLGRSKECRGGSKVTMLAQHDVNQSAVAIDRAIEISPSAPHPDICLVDVPAGPTLPLRRRRRSSANAGVSLISNRAPGLHS